MKDALGIRQPRAILLDFYGTVVAEDDEPLQRVVEQVAAASRGKVAAREVADYYTRVYDGLCNESWGPRYRLQKDIEKTAMARLVAHFEADLDALAMAQTIIEYWRRPLLFPETRETLARCPVPVCLVSNIDNAELFAAMEYHGLSFCATVTSEDCRGYKPRPELFRRALALLGLAEGEVLHVGDSIVNDVRGAQALGIPVLWVNRNGRAFPPGGKPPNLESPDLTGIAKVFEDR